MIKLFFQVIFTLLMAVVLISLSHFIAVLAVSVLIVSTPYLIYQWRKQCSISSGSSI